MVTFDLLNKKIQKVIHEMKWENFKPIQDEAITHMITTPSDMIISAPTASGKTEAAFLPIISKIVDSGKESVKILYISPLKALINDQFLRVENLCKHIDFPITKWHGDSSQSKKKSLIKSPAGILLITPESIEALFLNKSEQLTPLFKNLEYIVIDEIHSFIGNERGTQLRSLINRLETTVNIKPYKIALSATISNLKDVAGWINPNNSNSVKIIEDKGSSKEIKGEIKCYYEDDLSLEEDLFNYISKGKNLIFANAKIKLEAYCDAMKNIAKKKKFSDIFYIHHGSLSKELRENCEELLKKESNISVFCSSTLELGIDIGNIDKVVFLDPPTSVSSMIQRLGRSGRRANASKEFRFYITENKLHDNSRWNDKFRVALVQSIAIIELMLEGFSEPLNTKTFDYSTFVHQILSYLGQTGGATATNIFHNIAEIAFNNFFSKTDFIDILKKLKSEKIIDKLPDGNISLDKLGEKIVENYEFYAAFTTEKEWKVVSEGKEIGQIQNTFIHYLKEGDYFILAGKRWEILDLKRETRIVLVKEAHEKKLIQFKSSIPNIHRTVHQKMLEIYKTHFIPVYLNESSKCILQEAFENYDTYVNIKEGNILPILEGSKIHNTIKLLLIHSGEYWEESMIGYYSLNGKATIINFLKSINFKKLNINSIIEILPSTAIRKFDKYLPQNILNKSYEQEYLDFKGTEEFIKNL